MLKLGSARVNGPAFAAEKLGYTSARFKYNINHTHALMEICTVYVMCTNNLSLRFVCIMCTNNF